MPSRRQVTTAGKAVIPTISRCNRLTPVSDVIALGVILRYSHGSVENHADDEHENQKLWVQGTPENSGQERRDVLSLR